MTGHIGADRMFKVAHGKDVLTPEEVNHVEHCSDCVDAMAELIRKRITQEKRDRLA